MKVELPQEEDHRQATKSRLRVSRSAQQDRQSSGGSKCDWYCDLDL